MKCNSGGCYGFYERVENKGNLSLGPKGQGNFELEAFSRQFVQYQWEDRYFVDSDHLLVFLVV